MNRALWTEGHKRQDIDWLVQHGTIVEHYPMDRRMVNDHADLGYGYIRKIGDSNGSPYPIGTIMRWTGHRPPPYFEWIHILE